MALLFCYMDDVWLGLIREGFERIGVALNWFVVY